MTDNFLKQIQGNLKAIPISEEETDELLDIWAEGFARRHPSSGLTIQEKLALRARQIDAISMPSKEIARDSSLAGKTGIEVACRVITPTTLEADSEMGLTKSKTLIPFCP